MKIRDALCWVASALVGYAAGWTDVHAEEVQPAVLLLVVGGLLVGAAQPRRAWRWALVIGASVPLAHAVSRLVGHELPYVVDSYWATFLAFPFAFAGTYLGVGAAHLFRQVRRENA